MKFFVALSVSLLGLATFANAEEAASTILPKTEAKVCEANCAKECTGGCPLQAAMNKLPQLTFSVGNETTCCEESAAKLAKEHEAPVHYVVGKKTYETKNAAMVALADVTEEYVTAFAAPKTCAVSGKISVAGKELCCEVMAGQRVQLIKDAMAKVSMTYMVGKKACQCPNEAASLAKSSGEEQIFVVGNEKTCCSTTARLSLARAKYKAAVEALAKVDAGGGDQS